MQSQINGHSTVYLTDYVDPHKKHKRPHYWPFVRGIHRWPVNSPHKGPGARKKIPVDDVIMVSLIFTHMLQNYFTGTGDCLGASKATPGICSLKRHRLVGDRIPHKKKLRPSDDPLRFIIGIPIPIRRCLFGEERPWWMWARLLGMMI